ncbi:unnamed protein product [Cyclocybe aegerita]|uniref:Uncharacterized protein n=1 Tax=Cyclocybe aegerita TaxID=1973307 RepID=A0A8S0WQ52_CYCAE|nr:unnamed protein product [Cyclocybe aegerita]
MKDFLSRSAQPIVLQVPGSNYELRYSPSPSPPPAPIEQPTVIQPPPARPRKKETKSKRANKPKVDKGKKKVVTDLTACDSDGVEIVAHPRNGSVDSLATNSRYRDSEPPKKRRRVEKNPNVAPAVNSLVGEWAMLQTVGPSPTVRRDNCPKNMGSTNIF